MSRPRCWFASNIRNAGECYGELVPCHLIDKQWMRIAFPNGAVFIDGRWVPPVEAQFITRTRYAELPRRTLRQLQEDERSWVPGCGGISGLAGHHGRFDTAAHDSTRLVVPRALLPAATEEYALELGLDWRLARHYV